MLGSVNFFFWRNSDRSRRSIAPPTAKKKYPDKKNLYGQYGLSNIWYTFALQEMLTENAEIWLVSGYVQKINQFLNVKA